MEAKFSVLYFQNCPLDQTPFSIVAFRPQSNDEVLIVAFDICNVVERVASITKSSQFTNFTTYGISLETKDIAPSIL